MKRLICIASSLCLFSCYSEKTSFEYPSTFISGERLVKDTDNPTSVATVAEVRLAETQRWEARKLAYGKEFIDLNIDSISYLINSTGLRPDEQTLAQIKAVIYRFYSHVKVEEGMLICELENGDQIHISERVFYAYKRNLEETNKSLRKALEEGVELYVGDLDERVLSALFDE